MGEGFASALLQFGLVPSLSIPFSCPCFFLTVCAQVRCVYRTIEFAQGLGNGYLVNHEGKMTKPCHPFKLLKRSRALCFTAFFYVFDSLPLLIGISAYAVYWPSLYLRPSIDTPSDEMSAVNSPEA